MGILDKIIFAPIKATILTARTLEKSAKKEMTDEKGIYEALMHLQERLEMDEIDEETFYQQEEELMEKLNRAREMKDEDE
ncbi:MAG: gas vesicle protein GvpG [Desulfobacterales bacterium]|nr:gas vesicle protein GvpG [Desulfobacterales bacterium]